MKKITAFLLLLVLVLTAVPGVSFAASQVDQDGIFDKISDWFAVLGKPEEEKDMILAERRAARAARRLGKAWRQETNKAAKKMEQFGKDMEKAFQ